MGKVMKIGRDEIVRAIVEAIEPLEYVYAFWEGGAVAFGRVDEWSDIDICVDAEDSRVQDVFPVAERAMESLAPIELKYDMPGPLLGEYVQAFYRLAGTGKFMLVDFAVFKHSAEDKLLEPEIHGTSKFHFNKDDAVRVPNLDHDTFLEAMKRSLAMAKQRFEVFSPFVEKEIKRRNFIEALGLYHRIILDPLVGLLRMKYKPVRYGFRTRYVNYDLPGEVTARLVDLYFVADHKDLVRKNRKAVVWFEEMVGELNFDEIERLLPRAD